jgi:hypothetical protein
VLENLASAELHLMRGEAEIDLPAAQRAVADLMVALARGAGVTVLEPRHE